MFPEEEESEDAWPDEPAEFDPQSLGPDIPEVAQSNGSGDATADSETLQMFYAAVLFANVGLLGISLGPMLWYFRGLTETGAGLTLVGFVALGMTYRQYRLFRTGPADTTPSGGV